MHQPGDIVRLVKGWTPMCVIGFDDIGDVMASYFNYSATKAPCKITVEHYKNPEDFYDYVRPQRGFTVWDGAKFKMKVTQPMPTRFKLLSDPRLSGELISHEHALNTVILRMDHGGIVEVNISDVKEDIPYTFQVACLNNRNPNQYKCHYSLPPGASVSLNDVLLSAQGNLYRVCKLNTECRTPKKVFEGQRMRTVPL